MAEQIWERLDPMVARWKKFTGPDDAERLAAVEHSLTPELQRLVKEFDEVRADINSYVAALEKKYQSVIDRYQLSWLDFDIEGGSLSNTAANKRRNVVLADLQAKNPGLMVSFTLPVDPDGISAESQNLLADAVSRGVKIHSVNVMTMDFGAHFSKGKKMSAVSIASAVKAHDQCRNIAPDVRIGITPMIGQNDEAGEVFNQQDARTVKQWAQEQPWICSLSFWASNRDAGHMDKNKTGNDTSGIRQKPWAFTRIFKSFTGGQ